MLVIFAFPAPSEERQRSSEQINDRNISVMTVTENFYQCHFCFEVFNQLKCFPSSLLLKYTPPDELYRSVHNRKLKYTRNHAFLETVKKFRNCFRFCTIAVDSHFHILLVFWPELCTLYVIIAQVSVHMAAVNYFYLHLLSQIFISLLAVRITHSVKKIESVSVWLFPCLLFKNWGHCNPTRSCL